jgi:membrane protease YdiL (CAAX protease family)
VTFGFHFGRDWWLDFGFGLGLVNAHWMFKTDSIWESMLFHAGYDLIVIIPIIVSAS